MPTPPRWMPVILKLAALYNLSYAVILALWPQQVFHSLQLPPTPTPMIQCIGMMVGIYALAYWIAAQDMLRYWPLVVVGLVGKTLGPLGFFQGVLTGVFSWHSIWFVAFSDLAWWLPFWVMSLYGWKHRKAWHIQVSQ